MLTGGTGLRVRPAWTCGQRRPNAGRPDRIRGILVTLRRGGGHEVAHSSESP
jgi:hypothetical protein